MERARLPRLDSAQLPPGDVDDRLTEGFEELRTRKVLEFARAFRNGEAPARQARVPAAALPRRGDAPSDNRRAAPRSTVTFTQLESLDEEIRQAAEKEKKMRTQDKVFTVVHDRRTHKRLMLAQTVTRLPKLDLSRVHDKDGNGAGQVHTERSEAARRRGEKEGTEGKAGKKEKHERHREGPFTDRPRGALEHGMHEHASPAAGKKAAAKASAEVTEWKRHNKVKHSLRPRMESERLRPLKLPRGTWKQRVAGATASEETTEWKGLTKVHKLQQSWLNSETEFRALLASFGANYHDAEPEGSNQPDASGDESQSFFLTSSLTSKAASPPPKSARKPESDHGGSSDNDEERMNGMLVSKRRLTIVAPTISLDDDDDDDDDDDGQAFVEASQLRAQARHGALSSSGGENHQPEAVPEAPDTTGERGEREDREAQTQIQHGPGLPSSSGGEKHQPEAEVTAPEAPDSGIIGETGEREDREAQTPIHRRLPSNDVCSEPAETAVTVSAATECLQNAETLGAAHVNDRGADAKDATCAACDEASQVATSAAQMEQKPGQNNRQEAMVRREEWARGIGEQVSSIANLIQNSPPRNRAQEAHACLLESEREGEKEIS